MLELWYRNNLKGVKSYVTHTFWNCSVTNPQVWLLWLIRKLSAVFHYGSDLIMLFMMGWFNYSHFTSHTYSCRLQKSHGVLGIICQTVVFDQEGILLLQTPWSLQYWALPDTLHTLIFMDWLALLDKLVQSGRTAHVTALWTRGRFLFHSKHQFKMSSHLGLQIHILNTRTTGTASKVPSLQRLFSFIT